MKRHLLLSSGLCLLLSILSVNVRAAITVSTMRINIPANKSLPNGVLNNYKEITISNRADKVAYVLVNPYKVNFPGEKRQYKQKQELLNPLQFGLVVSRQKLIIPPKQSRVVRFMPLIHNNKKDIVYEVIIVPAVNQFAKTKVPNKTVLSGLTIVMGYQIGVILRPVDPKPILNLKREGRQLVFKNTGNTNVIFYKGKQCLGKKCQSLPDHRLYAGNTWHYRLPFNTSITYIERYPSHKKTVSI